MKIILSREYDPEVTDGEITDENGDHICYSLELPWLQNEQKISCIPEGEYKFSKMFSQKLGWVYRLKNVSGRSLIDIHKGNSVLDIEGCILVGMKRGTINEKGRIYPAVLNSKDALDRLFELIGMDGTITIAKGK